MKIWRSAAPITCMLLAIAGCSEEPPLCASEQVETLLKQIVKNQHALDQNLKQYIRADETKYEVNAVITVNTKGTIRTCRADFTSLFRITEAGKSYFGQITTVTGDVLKRSGPIEYTVSLTDDRKQVYVHITKAN